MSRAILACLALMALCSTSCPGIADVDTHAQPAPGASHHRINPERAHRELASILSQPEYNRQESKSFAQLVLEKIGKILGTILKWIGEVLALRFGGGAGRLASFVFAWSVVLAFVYLLYLIARRLSASLQRTQRPQDDAFATYELPSAGPLIHQAAKLADAGDYRAAFRCAYLASISYLDEIKALRFERSRTNWEYLRELDQAGFEMPRDELQPLTSDFDRKFYGREPCSEQDYLNALVAYERICQVTPA